MDFVQWLELPSQWNLGCQIAELLRHWDVMHGTCTARFAHHLCHYLYVHVLGFYNWTFPVIPLIEKASCHFTPYAHTITGYS